VPDIGNLEEDVSYDAEANILDGTTYVVADIITPSSLLVERFRDIQVLIAQERNKTLSPDGKLLLAKYNKYFQNKRKLLGAQCPSIEECKASPVGYAFGVIMDSSNPATMWTFRSGESASDAHTSATGPSSQDRHYLPDSNRTRGRLGVEPSPVHHQDSAQHQQHGPRRIATRALNILADVAWSDEADAQLLASLNTRLDSSLRCLSDCGDAVSNALVAYLEAQQGANEQWAAAMVAGRAAYDALGIATVLSREYHQQRNVYMVLHQEFLDCLARRRLWRKRSRDEMSEED
jgi:hypothetical protein